MPFLPVNNREPLKHTVAFRLTTSEYLELLPFFEVFENQSAALRWLFTQPECLAVMGAAVAAAMQPAVSASPTPSG